MPDIDDPWSMMPGEVGNGMGASIEIGDVEANDDEVEFVEQRSTATGSNPTKSGHYMGAGGRSC